MSGCNTVLCFYSKTKGRLQRAFFMIYLVKSFRPQQWVVLWFLPYKVKRVLGTILGLHDLHLPILGEHVENRVCSLFFRRLRRAYSTSYGILRLQIGVYYIIMIT